MFNLPFIKKLIEFTESQRNKNLYLFFFGYYFVIIITGITSFIFGTSEISKIPNNVDLAESVVIAYVSYFILIIAWIFSGIFEGSTMHQYFNINKIINDNISPLLELINIVLPMLLVLIFIFLLIEKPLLLILLYLIYTVFDGLFSMQIKTLYNKSKTKIESTLSGLKKSNNKIEITNKQMFDYFCGNYKINLVKVRIFIIATSLFFYQHTDVLYVAFSVSILINEAYFLYKRLPIYREFYSI